MRFLVPVLMLLIGTSALAQKMPDKIKLTSRSADGAVLIKLPQKPFDYALILSKGGSSGFLSRAYVMKVKANEPKSGYIARTLAPGRYRLDSVVQQDRWSACLSEGTIEFDVASGKINFLGTFDLDLIFKLIQTDAVAAGREKLSRIGLWRTFGGFDPSILGGNVWAALPAAKDFAQTSMNGSGALVEINSAKAKTFEISAANRTLGICG